MELLLLGVEEPNRVGVGVVDVEVVELTMGLPDIKENAGFGAAEESAALCPKVKDGFGASAVVVSLLSAGLPKLKVVGGCSVGALVLLKENPPVAAGAGAASASLLAAPKRKPDGAEDAAASFFSSGFPKAKVGAAGSLSAACRDPNVEPPGGVGVVELRSPNLPNTDLLLEVEFVDAVSFDDAALSLFSCEDEELSGVFSLGFESPKVKPVLEELLSVLEDPVPNGIPPLAPNLNPEPAAGGSDFLSSLEASPNVKPSDELPNLNPEEAVVSLYVLSDGTPNLNPPDDEEEDSVNEPPNLKPAAPDPKVLSVVPNLNPPEVVPEVPPADEPKDEPKALGSTIAPGLAV